MGKELGLGVCQVGHNEEVKPQYMKEKKFITYRSQRGRGANGG